MSIKKFYTKIVQGFVRLLQVNFTSFNIVFIHTLGDLTEQKAVRERLQCKSFDWFMKEIAFDQDRYYPAVDPPPSAHGSMC